MEAERIVRFGNLAGRVESRRGKNIIGTLKNLDAIRERIVRCRDCEHWQTKDLSAIYGHHKNDVHACFRFVDGWRMETNGDDFCSHAEPREKEQR